MAAGKVTFVAILGGEVSMCMTCHNIKLNARTVEPDWKLCEYVRECASVLCVVILCGYLHVMLRYLHLRGRLRPLGVVKLTNPQQCRHAQRIAQHVFPGQNRQGA